MIKFGGVLAHEEYMIYILLFRSRGGRNVLPALTRVTFLPTRTDAKV